MSESFYGCEVPRQLREVPVRHQRHIAELVGKLRAAGLDEESIEEIVDQLVVSYRSQLLDAVKALGVYRA